MVTAVSFQIIIIRIIDTSMQQLEDYIEKHEPGLITLSTIFTNPSAQAGYDTRSEFSFS